VPYVHSVLNNRNKVSMNILVEKDISLLTEEGESIIVINVPMADRHSKPIFINGDVFRGTYKRGHEGDFHCTEEEVKAMMADSLDSQRNVPFAPLHCLSKESLASYRQVFSNRNLGHPWTTLNNEEFLIRLGTAVKEDDHKISLTKEGLLCLRMGLK